MGCSTFKEIAVFAQTNLGTRLAIPISPETTVRDFKREFERAHLNCFRELGEIRVHRLKVKKKSRFYDLPESFPLKYVFQSLKDHFLHIEVYHLQHQSGSAEVREAEICDHASDINNVLRTEEVQNFVATPSKNRKGSRRKIQKRKMKRFFSFKSLFLEFPRGARFLKRDKNKSRKRKRNIAAKNPVNGFQQGPQPHFSEDTDDQFVSRNNGKWVKEFDNYPRNECPSETFSETISVSGIITRYFTNYDEVTSSSRFSFSALPTVNKKEHLVGEISGNYQNRELDMSDKKNIGRRIIAASDNLGVYGSKHTPTLSLCKSRGGKLSIPNNFTTPIRSLVFDITDEEDLKWKLQSKCS